VFQRAPYVRFRYDTFGGLAWKPRGLIYKIVSDQAMLLEILQLPRRLDDVREQLPEVDVEAASRALVSNGLLTETSAAPVRGLETACALARSRAAAAGTQTINKPFWAHIQPFTFCNQRCIHCYCHGDSRQSRLPLSLETWRSIVDKIVDFGVLEIYITGGENFIVDEYFKLAEYVMASGCTTGLSTNAMHVPQRAIDFIVRNEITSVQVSLDGATSETNDRIRGTPGAHVRSLRGIEALRRVTTPVLNMVVNRINCHEVEALVRLGLQVGVSSFKFYPQKAVGRGVDCRDEALTADEWSRLRFDDLARAYGVAIESPSSNVACGSGYSGFAVNEEADVFPCIFGVHNSATKIGNIMKDDLESLWFMSPKLKMFRTLSCAQPCTRCEAV